ncbi:hypothetical protein ACJX0J_042582, partial [Zea mays]
MFAWGAAFSFPIFIIFYASNLYCLFLFTFVLVLGTCNIITTSSLCGHSRSENYRHEMLEPHIRALNIDELLHLPHHLHTLFVSCFIDENLTFKVDVLCLLVAHVKSIGWVFYDLFWLNINPKILFGVARKTISNMID